MSALDTIEDGDVHYWHAAAIKAQDEVEQLRREPRCEHCVGDDAPRGRYYVLTDHVEAHERDGGREWFGWSVYTGDNEGIDSFDTYAEAVAHAAKLNDE